tara:strand:+ start:5132 stop:5659 length:528 start_codon:yes stop_codon:yes gene_type:complete
MKLEMLTLLLPKTVDMTAIGMGKSHDSVTAEDINTALSYANLTKDEVAIIMAKFLNDNQSRSDLFYSFYLDALDIFEDVKLKKGSNTIRTIIDCCLVESLLQACPFCNGVGQNVFNNTIEKCNHCKEGMFIFDDDSRMIMIGLDKAGFLSIKKGYTLIMSRLRDLEDSALEKLNA